jgi:plastocyanin
MSVSRLFGNRPIAVLILAVLVFAAQATTAQTVQVYIDDFFFQPDSIEISIGTTVIWESISVDNHTTTSTSGLWDSGIIPPGGIFSYTFNSAGVYHYFCDIHPGLIAVIVVSPEQAPSLTPYGVAVLLLLLLGTALWVMRRRKAVTVEK